MGDNSSDDGYVETRRKRFIDPVTDFLYGAFVKPAVWIRENIVEPNRQDYPW